MLDSFGPYTGKMIRLLYTAGIIAPQDRLTSEPDLHNPKYTVVVFDKFESHEDVASDLILTGSILPFRLKHRWYIKNDADFEGPYLLTTGGVIDLIRSGKISRSAYLWHGGLEKPEEAASICRPKSERYVYEKEIKIVRSRKGEDIIGIKENDAETYEVWLRKLDFGPLRPQDIRVMLGNGQLLHGDRVRPTQGAKIHWKNAPRLEDVFGDTLPRISTTLTTIPPILSLPFVVNHKFYFDGKMYAKITTGEIIAWIRSGVIPLDTSIQCSSCVVNDLPASKYVEFGFERFCYDREMQSHGLPRYGERNQFPTRFSFNIKNGGKPDKVAEQERLRQTKRDSYWIRAKEIVSKGLYKFDFRA